VKDLHAYVNQVMVDGFTALIAAAKRGRVDVVLCLVRHLGADVTQLNADVT
jgi:ankyrin repeat protein